MTAIVFRLFTVRLNGRNNETVCNEWYERKWRVEEKAPRTEEYASDRG